MNRTEAAHRLVRIAKALVSRVEMEEVSRSGRRRLYLVKDDDVVVGFLSKFSDTRTEESPWQAFEANFRSGRPVVGRLIDSFFEADGGRKAALKALGV